MARRYHQSPVSPQYQLFGGQNEHCHTARRRPRRLTQKHYFLAIIFGAAWGAIIAMHTGQHAALIMGAVTGISFLLSVVAFQECLSLRRRLDAVLVVLRKSEG
jgi:hypothetical protein